MGNTALTAGEISTLADAAGTDSATFEDRVSSKVDDDGLAILRLIAARIKALGG